MVSLLKLAKITEDGVNFESPYDGSQKLLTPEESIRIQNSIGADIMKQVMIGKISTVNISMA